MRTKMLIIAIGLLMASGAAIAQPAARRGQMWMGHHAPFLTALKLTDKQKTEVRNVWFNLMQQQIDVRANLEHARLDFHEQASATTPDQNALNADIKKMADLKAQLQQNKLNAWFEVNKLLTPEQQKIWQKVLEHPMFFQARAKMMLRERFGGGMKRQGMMMGRPGMMRGSGPWQNTMTQQAPQPSNPNN